MRSLVSFKNIKKSYDGEKLVVRNLNLDVQEGEFLTLLGPSGSGKTTSLMMLAGFETPTDGEIFLRDKPLHTLPPHQRDIGMVFQNYALFPHMTVADHLLHRLRIRTRRLHPLLRLADFGGRDHFERTRHLAGVLHALDLGFDFASACHLFFP